MIHSDLQNQYTYDVFGLIVVSDVLIPEFAFSPSKEAQRKADVYIKWGDVDQQLPLLTGAILKRKGVKKTTDTAVLSVPGVAKYLIKQGRSITIQATPTVDIHSIRLFLLGSAFSFLLQQRQMFCLHASGIMDHDGRGILFLGKSGAGKSTTCRYLVDKGYQYISDDYLGIEWRDEHAYAIPGYPKQKLWQESIDLLDIDTAEIHHQIRPDMDKYALIDESFFHHEPLPIKACYLLLWSDVDTVQTSELAPSEAFKFYFKNTYRKKHAVFPEERERLFDHCRRLSQQIPLIEIKRSKTKESLHAIHGIITEQTVV